MIEEQYYKIKTTWVGNRGTGTSAVSEYDRLHTIENGIKPVLNLTTDDATYGDKSVLNPEDLLVSALSSCHMMSYLYLCAKANVVVVEYIDNATGILEEFPKGGGKFREVILHPNVVVKSASMLERAEKLHHLASEICYIANSVNFEVKHQPVCTAENQSSNI